MKNGVQPIELHSIQIDLYRFVYIYINALTSLPQIESILIIS